MMKKQYQPTQHTHTLKLTVKNHMLKYIPLKLKQKKRTQWENHKICQKRKDLHIAAKLKDSQISFENQIKFNKTKKELTSAYDAEQSKYVNRKIKDIEIAAAKNNLLLHGKS